MECAANRGEKRFLPLFLKTLLVGALAGLCLLSLLVGCDRESRVSNDFTAAEEAAQSRDWPQAARLLQRYLREEMDAEKRWAAWSLLIDTAQRMEENGWVTDYLEIMLQEYGKDDSRVIFVLRRLGDSYESAGQWEKASAVWLRLLSVAELAPNEAASLYRRMGLFQQRSQNFEMAADMFDMCAEHAATPSLIAECRFLLADVYAAQDHFDKALEQVDRVVERKDAPTSLRGRAYLLQGDIRQQQGKTVEAAAAFRAALPLYPNPAVIQKRIERLGKK